MVDWGWKVSKPGFDVKTTGDKNLVYTSKYRGMKIKTHNTRSTAGNVSHGISGYVPMFLNFYLSSGKYRIENNVYRTTDNYSDTTNIVFGGTNNYYFIFIDKGD